MDNSVTEAVISFLLTYPEMGEGAEIATDQLGDDPETNAIFQTPGDEVLWYVDGSRLVTSAFVLRLRRPSLVDEQRVALQSWMEAFERWVRDQMVLRNRPALDSGRSCRGLRFTAAAFMYAQDAHESVYQIGVECKYFEPKTKPASQQEE